MGIFHTTPAIRKLARAIVWAIPAFTLPFFVIGIAASSYLWPVVAVIYSAFVVGLGYCDTHLAAPGTALINTASPGKRFQFSMGFFGLQIFLAPIILILVGGFMYLGISLVTKILGM